MLPTPNNTEDTTTIPTLDLQGTQVASSNDKVDTTTIPTLDLQGTPTPTQDKYSGYTNPRMVEWLDTHAHSLKATGDALNAMVDSTGEAIKTGAEYTAKEGPFKAAAQIVARTGVKASEALTTAPFDMLSLAASGTLKIIDNLDPIDQIRYQDARDNLEKTKRVAEFSAGFLHDELEKLYSGTKDTLPFLHPTDTKDQSTLDTIADIGAIGGGAAQGISKLGGITKTEISPVTSTLKRLGIEIGDTSVNVGKAAVGEFMFTPHNNTLNTISDSSKDTPAEKRLRSTAENAVVSEMMGVAIPLAKATTKAVDAISEPLGGTTSKLIRDESGSIKLPGFLRGDFEGEGSLPDKNKALQLYDDVLQGKAKPNDYDAYSFEQRLLSDQNEYAFTNPKVAEEYKQNYAQGQILNVDPLSEVGATATSKNPEVQARLAEEFGSRTRAPSGVTLPTMRSVYVNTLSVMDDIYKSTTGINNRFYYGEPQTLVLLEHGGAATTSQGFLTGVEGSPFVTILDDFGLAKEVPGVYNLSTRIMKAMDGIVKPVDTTPIPEGTVVPIGTKIPVTTKEGALNVVKDVMKAWDNYDNYVILNSRIKDDVQVLAEAHGINYEDLFNPKAEVFLDPEKGEIADELSRMIGFGIPGSKPSALVHDLENDTIIKGLTNLLGKNKTTRDAMTRIADNAKLKPNNMSRDEVARILIEHQDEDWFQEFTQQTAMWNQTQAYEMFKAGRISEPQLQELIQSRSLYLPNFKEVEEIGTRGVKGSTGGQGGLGLSTRTITEHESQDPIKALLQYTQNNALANTRSRVNNMVVKRIVSDFDDENFKLMFAQDRQKVLKAINDSINNVDGERKVYDAFDLLPDGVKREAEEATVTSLEGNKAIFINGHTINLTPLDTDLWSLMVGLKHERMDNTILNAYRDIGKLWSYLLIKINPILPAAVATKEWKDTLYVSQLPYRQRLLATSRMTQLADTLHGMIFFDSKPLLKRTSEYERNAGLSGVSQQIDWSANPYNKAQLLENFILSGGQSVKATRGFRGLLRPLSEAFQKYQSGMDTFIRAPEAEALIKAGLNPHDAYGIASYGSTAFRAQGAGSSGVRAENVLESIGKSREVQAEEIPALNEAFKAHLLALSTSPIISQIVKETPLSRAVIQSGDVFLRMVSKHPVQYIKTTAALTALYTGYQLAQAGATKTLDRANSYDYQNQANMHLTDKVLWSFGFHGQFAGAATNFIVRTAGATAKEIMEKFPDEYGKIIKEKDPELAQAIMRSGGRRVMYGIASDLYQAASQFAGFGLGIPSTLGAITGITNEDSFGRDVISPINEDQPYDYLKTGYNTSEATKYLTRTWKEKHDLDVSPARMELLIESFPLGNMLMSGMESTFNKMGLIPEPTATKWSNTRYFRQFNDQNDLYANQIHNAKIFNTMYDVAYIAKEQDKAEEEQVKLGKMSPADFAANRSSRQEALQLGTYFEPYKKAIKNLNKQIESIKAGTIPGTDTPVSERSLIHFSEEKQRQVNNLRDQIFQIQNYAVEGLYASAPHIVEKIDYAVYEHDHPALAYVLDKTSRGVEAAKSTITKLLTIQSNAPVNPFKDEQQIPTIEPGVPVIELSPEVSAETVQAAASLNDIPDALHQRAVNTASRVTGVDPSYLTIFMAMESRLGQSKNIIRTDGRATGVFQITPDTWKSAVKKYGEEYGIAMKDINDPTSQAIITGLLMKEDMNNHKKNFGENPSVEQLYMYHFMGHSTATKFIAVLKSDNPYIKCSDVVPSSFLNKTNNAYYGDKGSNTVFEAYRLIKQRIRGTYQDIKTEANTTLKRKKGG